MTHICFICCQLSILFLHVRTLADQEKQKHTSSHQAGTSRKVDKIKLQSMDSAGDSITNFSQAQANLFQLQPQARAYGEYITSQPEVFPTSAIDTSSRSSAVSSHADKMYKIAYQNSRKPTKLTHSNSVKVKESPPQTLQRRNSLSNSSNFPTTKLHMGQKSIDVNNKTLRWDNECSNSDDEKERINEYKLNRRKRYLAAANQKYSDWLKTLHDIEPIQSVSSSVEKNHIRRSTESTNFVTNRDMLLPNLAPQMAHKSASQVPISC